LVLDPLFSQEVVLSHHPRQGWSEPDERSAGFSRRDLIKRGAGLGALVGLAPALAACGGGTSSSSGGGGGGANSGLPRPNNPVTWPISASNPAIANGLPPESNATLKVYNWVAYVNPQSIKNFEKQYKCKVEVTTFNTMEEAIEKLSTGQLGFDVFVPTIDQLGPIIEKDLIQPLNHSYIPNISNAWKEFENPFYDQKWQYTVPYTIYTTGISWRNDHVSGSPTSMSNPWNFLWQAKYKGKVAILDDYRESMSLGLMHNGITDLNTTDTTALSAAEKSLLNLASLTDVHIDNNDYSNIPSGQMWIHHSWSGDIAAAASYMPKGVSVDVVSYWFPADGKGPVNNDTMAVLKGGQNPVLAHLFLNYFLNTDNALENISFNGYMQPLQGVTPKRLIGEKILPPNLASTVVLESNFNRGLFELELPAAANTTWQQDWLNVSKGV
jgi:spermidine/putrescine transport system substrate-binding protein